MDKNQPDGHLPLYIKVKSGSGEDIHYSTETRLCPEEVKVYAKRELNETDENKVKGIQKLRAYIKKNDLVDIEDVFLIAILRCSKYNIKKAETKLRRFLNLQHLVIKNLKKVEPKVLEQLIDDGLANCLPYSDKHGRPIYFFQPNINLDLYNYEDMAAYAQACLFSVLTYPLPTTKGVTLLVDCNVKSPSICFSMFKAYRKYLGLEKTIPIRVGRLDFVNENVITHYLFNILRPILPSKIVDRIAFHGTDLKSLHKIYNPDILPDVLGGTMGPIDTNLFKEEKLKALEKLRSEKFF